jgi:peptide/nickel transport system substrate-binding protein
MKKTIIALCAAILLIGNVAAAGPGKENVFTFTRQADMNTWNTFLGTDTNSVLVGRLLYDPLITGDRKGTYSPCLATSWTASADDLTWTFKLRSDVKYHNGDAFTSADVKYTFERFVNDKTVRSMNDWSSLASVDAPDPTTAVFHFKKVMATFLNALLDTWIPDSKLIAAMGDKAFDKPVGQGAWKFVSWAPGQAAIFQRNDDYWNWGGKKSNVDKIVFKPILEDSTRFAAIQTGDVDSTEALNLDQAKQLAGVKGVVTIPINSTAMANMQFKFENSIFADQKIRQAVSLAIDRQLIVDAIAGGGHAQAWLCTSADMGYKDIKPVYDPAKAKQLLSESTYKGQAFKILAVTGQLPRSTEVLQTIASMLNAVGLNASVQFMESAALVAQRTGGNYDCYIVSGATSAGDPTPMVAQRWLNDLFKSGFKNEKMFDLIRLALTQTDAKKRADTLTQIFQMNYDQVAPGMCLYQISVYAATRDNISGIIWNADGTNDYSRVMKK